MPVQKGTNTVWLGEPLPQILTHWGENPSTSLWVPGISQTLNPAAVPMGCPSPSGAMTGQSAPTLTFHGWAAVTSKLQAPPPRPPLQPQSQCSQPAAWRELRCWRGWPKKPTMQYLWPLVTAVMPQGSSPFSHTLQQSRWLARPGEARSASVIHSQRHRFTLMPPVFFRAPVISLQEGCMKWKMINHGGQAEKELHQDTEQTIRPFLPLLPEGLVPPPEQCPESPLLLE